MCRRSALVLFFIALSAAACNREGELRGDVFIVTQGAQNFKLGLVEVSAIPEAEMKKFLVTRASVVEPEIAKRQEEYNAIKQQYDEAVRQASEADRDYSDSIMSGDYERRLDYLNRKYDKAKTVDEIKVKLDAAESSLNDEKSATPFFVDMPKGIATATTDADGKFTMRLSSKGRFALVAHASRQVVGAKEEYYWIVWTSLENQSSKQVILSNNNLLQSGADIKVQTQ